MMEILLFFIDISEIQLYNKSNKISQPMPAAKGSVSIMPEPIRLHYKCHFCGMQTCKDLLSGPPNPGICNKSPKVDGFHTPHKWVIVAQKSVKNPNDPN